MLQLLLYDSAHSLQCIKLCVPAVTTDQDITIVSCLGYVTHKRCITTDTRAIVSWCICLNRDMQPQINTRLGLHYLITSDAQLGRALDRLGLKPWLLQLGWQLHSPSYVVPIRAGHRLKALNRKLQGLQPGLEQPCVG